MAELTAAQNALEAARDRTIEQDKLIVEAAVTGTIVETEAAPAAREGRSFEPAITLLARTRADRDRSLFADLEGHPSVRRRRALGMGPANRR